jgi:phage-related protein (TIGR01555 family)
MNIINNTLKLGSRIKKSIKIDGWENTFTGLGVFGRDKRKGNSIKRNGVNQRRFELLYDNSDIGRRIVEIIPSRGTTKWISRTVDKSQGGIEMVNKLTLEDERLMVKEKFAKAWTWSRLYGGSGIFMSVDDGIDPSEPINIERISKFNSLTVLHSFELQSGEINNDINSPNFGMPEYYVLSKGSNLKIHHTRIIRFEGAPLSEQEFKNNGYWNDSVLNSLQDLISDYEGAYSGVAHAMTDFDVSILKLKNLADLVGGDEEGLIVSRLKLMNLAKSVVGSIIIDADEEDIENLARQFTNVDKVLDKMDQRLSTGTGIPHTVLFGDGASGALSGKGESEEKDMASLVSMEQSKVLSNNINRYDKIVQSSKQGPTNGKILDKSSWSFNALNEPSQKEVAETREITAKTDAIYLDRSVLSADEVAKSRFGGDEYSSETMIDVGARREQEDNNSKSVEESNKMKKELEDNA